MMAKYDERQSAGAAALLAGGAKLQAFSQAIMEACYKAAQELHAEIAARQRDVQEGLRQSMMAYTSNGYRWFQVAELGYDSS